MGAVESEQEAPERSSRGREPLLIVIGILWLLLGAAMLIGPFSDPPAVVIEWQTETELDVAGFHIYRSESPAGTFRRINEQLIPARGSSTAGDRYTFIDDNIEAGTVYYYRIVDVELDNTTQEQQVLEHQVPRAQQWMVFLALFSVVAGLLLLIQGFRQERGIIMWRSRSYTD